MSLVRQRGLPACKSTYCINPKGLPLGKHEITSEIKTVKLKLKVTVVLPVVVVAAAAETVVADE